MKKVKCTNFERILKNFEKNYIRGPFKKDSRTEREKVKFPIPLWNMYERVKEDKPRTNNCVESWDGTMSEDTKSHMTVNKVIEVFRTEQSNTQVWIAKLESVEIKKRKT